MLFIVCSINIQNTINADFFVYSFSKLDLLKVTIMFYNYLIYSILFYIHKKCAYNYWQKHELWCDFKSELKAELIGHSLLYFLFALFFSFGIICLTAIGFAETIFLIVMIICSYILSLMIVVLFNAIYLYSIKCSKTD